MTPEPDERPADSAPKTKLKDDAPETLVPDDLPEAERIDHENDVA